MLVTLIQSSFDRLGTRIVDEKNDDCICFCMMLGSLPAYLVLTVVFVFAFVLDVFVTLTMSFGLLLSSAFGYPLVETSHWFLRSYWGLDSIFFTCPENLNWEFPIGQISYGLVVQIILLNQYFGASNDRPIVYVEITLVLIFQALFLIMTYLFDLIANLVIVTIFMVPITVFSFTIWTTLFGFECSIDGLHFSIELLTTGLRNYWDCSELALNTLCRLVSQPKPKPKPNDDPAEPEKADSTDEESGNPETTQGEESAQ